MLKRLSPSPRKEPTTGLIVQMVVDELDDNVHRAAAVEVGPDDNYITWDRPLLTKVSENRGGLLPRHGAPAFSVCGASALARMQLQFNAWFSGSPYATRWFQAEFKLRDLQATGQDDDHHETPGASFTTRPRSLSGPLLDPWVVASRDQGAFMDTCPVMQHGFEVLHGRGRVLLTYAAVRFYDAAEGEVTHLVIHAISLQLLDKGMFRRFLAYRGHRITCALDSTYLYRANEIEDQLPVKVDYSKATHSRVESTRQRSGAYDSVDSSTSGRDAATPRQSHRRYTWKSRALADAAFPSVRDGHRPAAAEELLDLMVVPRFIGTKRREPELRPGTPPLRVSSSSSSEEIAADEVDGLVESLKTPAKRNSLSLDDKERVKSDRVSRVKSYVPDSPDYANTRFRLPYLFTRDEGQLLVHLFDFRSMPPEHIVVPISWMDLDQTLITGPPHSTLEPERKLEKRKSLAGFFIKRSPSAPSVPLLALLSPRSTRRKRVSPREEPLVAPGRRRGAVEKWLSEKVKLTVYYVTRPAFCNSVDIETVALDIDDYDNTLKSAELWGSQLVK